ncbi:Uncharacterised protein [Klebsiella pneumoniae]|nr:Uncharacterised protein [Klebsiella pneumoniae]
MVDSAKLLGKTLVDTSSRTSANELLIRFTFELNIHLFLLLSFVVFDNT